MTYKYLPYILMLYVTIKLAIVTVADKITTIHGIHVAVGSLMVPVWFIIGDVIAEIYGSKVARQCIYSSIACQVIFAIICANLVKLDSPIGLDQMFYTTAFARLPTLAFISCVSVLISGVLNTYVLTKLKNLLKGRHYFIRSLGASVAGEIVFTCIAVIPQFYKIESLNFILELLFISVLIKLIINPLVLIPSVFFVNMLKNDELSKSGSNANKSHPLADMIR